MPTLVVGCVSVTVLGVSPTTAIWVFSTTRKPVYSTICRRNIRPAWYEPQYHAVLPRDAKQHRWAVQKALQAVYQARVRRLVTSLCDGSLTLSSVHEEGPLLLKNKITISVSHFIDSNKDRGSHRSNLPIFAVFYYKSCPKTRKHNDFMHELHFYPMK